ncbi:MAG: hypothetical protein IPJ19_20880, partial [Planctomycetes bacterium]|nr:hypothetical protein [Planctomycetota bacterium]
ASLLGGGAAAQAQVSFSIDYFGPTNSVPNSFTGAPIRPSDILTPATAGIGMAGVPALGPLPVPGTLVPGGAAGGGLGLPSYTGCLASPPGVPCPNELDALSYGLDALPPAGVIEPPGTWIFSVDEFARGIPGLPLAPNVRSEGLVPGTFDASADIFRSATLPPWPVPPGIVMGNHALVDGDGLPSASGAVYPGFGVLEPRPPMAGAGARPGDNVDAFDLGSGPGAGGGGIYFSLDAAFFDPLRGVFNSGSGPANGFAPAAILNRAVPGAAIVVYAPPIALGLDLGGVGTDDLDALALRENGVPGYQIGAAGDVVRFSVRRGSLVVGMLDSLIGIPIEPGDILGPPAAAGLTPQIIVPAESLGLATARAGLGAFGDDLDALDANYVPGPIAPVPFCDPGVAGVLACPCANPAAGSGRGCDNSSATGGATLSVTGDASVLGDSLVFTTAAEKPTATSFLLQGDAVSPAGLVFGQGIRCVGGSLKRLYTKTASGGSITAPEPTDPKVSARSTALGDPILAGTSRYYGVYYRDPTVLGGCASASTFNITNQLATYWAP